MIFAPGDEVVCVDDNFSTTNGYKDETFPVRGQHYTVREMTQDFGDTTVRLAEIFNRVRLYRCRDGRNAMAEPSFFARRFRPVRREQIEIFRAMCVSNRPLVPVE